MPNGLIRHPKAPRKKAGKIPHKVITGQRLLVKNSPKILIMQTKENAGFAHNSPRRSFIGFQNTHFPNHRTWIQHPVTCRIFRVVRTNLHLHRTRQNDISMMPFIPFLGQNVPSLQRKNAGQIGQTFQSPLWQSLSDIGRTKSIYLGQTRQVIDMHTPRISFFQAQKQQTHEGVPSITPASW